MPHLKQLHRSLWQQRGTLCITPVVTGIVLAMRAWGWLNPLELALFDTVMRYRPAEPVDDRVMIVEVNEADLQQLQRWPLNDKTLTQVLDQIRRDQPAAIGLDLYRDYVVEPGHQQLTQLFETTPNLIGITKQSNPQAWQRVQPPKVLGELDQIGVNDVVVDRDGRLRRALLYLPTGDRVYESLGLRLALTYLEQREIFPNPDSPVLQLGQVRYPRLQANDGPYVKADDGGTQLLLNYRGGQGHFPRVPLSDLLAGRVPAGTFKHRVVLVGVTAVSLKDSFLTPYSQGGDPANPLEMPGVEFHANVVSHIISQVLDGRSGIHTISETQEMLWIGAWGLLGTGLAWRWRFVRRQRDWLGRLTGLGLIAGMLVAGHYGAFVQGYWVPLLPPLMTYVGGVAAVLAHTAYRAGEIRQTFGRYLSDEVVNQLLESPTGRQMGGERRAVTMLISDLRGFSAIAEQYAPEQVMLLLNHYLAQMTDVITQYQGTIDELMGDSILVMFGAPSARADDVDRACACAIAMQRAMPNLGDHLAPELAAQVRQLQMGIALHHGEVVVGNIGSMKRAKYGMVGSHINLTARIESYTVGGQILISECLQRQLQTEVELGQSMEIRAKGFPEPVLVHELRSIGGRYAQALPPLDEVLVDLLPAAAIEWTTIRSKQVQHPMLPGQVIQLSSHGAVLALPQQVEQFADVKLKWPGADQAEMGDMYAKVVEVLAIATPEMGRQWSELQLYRVRFTFVPVGMQQQLQGLIAGSIIQGETIGGNPIGGNPIAGNTTTEVSVAEG
jgi:adenylate cyclase